MFEILIVTRFFPFLPFETVITRFNTHFFIKKRLNKLCDFSMHVMDDDTPQDK